MKIVKSFSTYTIANIFEKGISFALLPLFTFYFNPSDYGILVLITTISTFTLPFISLGSNGAISANFFRVDRWKHSTYFSSAIVPPLAATVLISAIFFSLSDYIFESFNVPKIWFEIIPLFCFISFFNSLLLIEFQINNEPLKYITISISNTILNLLISIVFVVLLEFDYSGRLIAQYIIFIFYFFITFYILYNKRKRIIPREINIESIKDSLLFGLPLIPHSIGMIVMNMSDKFFIGKFLGTAELGIYNTAFIIGSSISILSASFANAIVPFSFEQFAKNNEASKISVLKIYLGFILILTFSLIFLWLFLPYIFKIFIGIDYQKGLEYAYLISIGFYFQGLYLLFANVIFYLKKTKIFLFWSMFNVGINITLNYFLIQFYGSMGAAITFSICYFLFLIVIASFSNKYFPLPWLKTIKMLISYD